MQPLHHSRAQNFVYQFSKARQAIVAMDAGADERDVSFNLIPGLIVALARLRDDERLWDGPRVSADFATRDGVQALVTMLSDARQDMAGNAAIDLDTSRAAISQAAEFCDRIKLGMLSYDASRHEESISVLDLAARAAEAYQAAPTLR